MLWGSGTQSGGQTLKAYYDECSQGRTALDVEGSLVTDFVIVGCSGWT